MSDYQGWTNYETWAVNLWLENNEGDYRQWKEAAEECWENAEANRYRTRSEEARSTLAGSLRDEMEHSVPEECNGTLWGDLIGAALSEVNWYEIANAWLEECEGYEAKDFSPASE